MPSRSSARCGRHATDLERRRRQHGNLVPRHGALRRDDDRSYETVLKRGITAVDTSENQAEWEAVGAQVRERLTGRVYPESLLAAVLAAAGGEQ